jgi:hypothetical protein
MIKLTVFLLATLFAETTDSLEQKACDYFFDNIFGREYRDYKVVEFQNTTDTSRYWGVVHQCKNWDEATKGEIVSAMPSRAVEIEANTNATRVKRINKRSGLLKIYVYSNIRVGENYYVSVAAYRKLRFAEYYFIKFDNKGTIIDTCKAGEII